MNVHLPRLPRKYFLPFLFFAAVVGLMKSTAPGQTDSDASQAAYRKESARLWDAIFDNKYAYIGKSVKWMIRVEHTAETYEQGLDQISICGDMFPGRDGHGQNTVCVHATNIGDAWSVNAFKRLSSSMLSIKEGEWIAFEGVIESAHDSIIGVAPTAIRNYGQHNDWK